MFLYDYSTNKKIEGEFDKKQICDDIKSLSEQIRSGSPVNKAIEKVFFTKGLTENVALQELRLCLVILMKQDYVPNTAYKQEWEHVLIHQTLGKLFGKVPKTWGAHLLTAGDIYTIADVYHKTTDVYNKNFTLMAELAAKCTINKMSNERYFKEYERRFISEGCPEEDCPGKKMIDLYKKNLYERAICDGFYYDPVFKELRNLNSEVIETLLKLDNPLRTLERTFRNETPSGIKRFHLKKLLCGDEQYVKRLKWMMAHN